MKYFIQIFLIQFYLLTTSFANSTQSFDYPKMFSYARDLLTRTPVQKFLKEVFKEELVLDEKLKQRMGYLKNMVIKNMSEHQFVLLLSHFPKLWPLIDEYIKKVPEIREDNEKQKLLRKEFRERFREAIDDKDVVEKFKKLNDPSMPMVLENPNGEGYSNIEFFVSHESRSKSGKTIPASDLLKVWNDFIAGAEKEVMFNVFDFDIQSIADQVIELANKGVKVTIGVDGEEAKTIEGVKAVYEKLSKNKKVTIVPVDSVGLNHQKMATRDWSIPKKAKVLLSSGNLTHSCLDPKGDVWNVPDNLHPKESIPNANHVITMDSELVANLIHHELTKTLDMKLKGRQYPVSGAWRIFRDGKFHEDVLDATQIVIAFSPSGGITGDINQDIISRLIYRTRGPIRMAQFAFSADADENALFERMKLEKKEGNQFDFKSIGENGFAQRGWSVFLSMSGYKMNEETGEYIPDSKNQWRKTLKKAEFEDLQKNIKAAPPLYRDRVVEVNGTKYKLSAKLHHKVLISGPWAIVGTSYNFSSNANKNQEQIMVTNDAELVDHAYAMFEGLYEQSQKSLTEAVESKNIYLKNDHKPSCPDKLK